MKKDKENLFVKRFYLARAIAPISLLVTVFCIKQPHLRIKCGILRKTFGKVIEN